MLLLGLLLLCGTAAFTGLLIANNLSGPSDQTIVLFGTTTARITDLEIFLSGAALALLFGLGLVTAGTGATLFRRRRTQLRDARRALAAHAKPGTSTASTASAAPTKPAERTGGAARASVRRRLLQPFSH